MRNSVRFVVAVVICELAGLIGSVFTSPAINGWYAGLVRPNLAPPSWVFAPVWTTLFALMGVAAALIWQKLPDKSARTALRIFAGQLVLNVLWSALFFGLRSPGAAFVEIIVLWFMILATIVAFSRISRGAGWLLLPYIAWVSFAAYLNFAFWSLN